MSQISILYRSIPLIVMGAACAGSAMTSAPPESSPPTGRVFHSAIAVRDESATAFFGQLAPGATPPSNLSIRFYDSGGAETATLSNLDVQVFRPGLVYAAP